VWWHIPVIPGTWEAEVGLRSEASPSKSETLFEKQTKIKKDWVHVLSVAWLPNKCKVLSSVPSTKKWYRLENWIKNKVHGCLQETHLTGKDKHRLKVKGQRKIFWANGAWKQAGVAIPISEKVNFKPKLGRRDKQGYFILIKNNSSRRYNIMTWARQWFLTYDSKSTSNKRKTYIGYCQNLKTFVLIKTSIKKVKRQPTELERTLKFVSNKELVSRLYKELL
jgi:hypothetical protein